MEKSNQNQNNNREHYNKVYSETSIERVLNQVENYERFLRKAVPTFTGWHTLYLQNFRGLLPGKRVLELGSGDGLNAFIMAKLGAEVTAIDISEESRIIIESVNQEVHLPVTAMSGDFLLLDFPKNSFDLVIGKEFLHHLTPDQEYAYLEKIASLLRPDGEARFVEPAVNSKILDFLRWITPVPGRPSKLNKKKFAEWKKHDPHPNRDNSTNHFRKIGLQYFREVQTEMVGSLERFHRLMPAGKFSIAFKQWAHRAEVKLPRWFRHIAARTQLIIYRKPKIVS